MAERPNLVESFMGGSFDDELLVARPSSDFQSINTVSGDSEERIKMGSGLGRGVEIQR